MDGLPKFANVQNEPRRMTEVTLDLPPNGMSIDLLRAVYRNDQLPLVTRMRAAIVALPFESPKLAVTAMVSEQDFATLLDQRLKRMEAMRADEANAQPVEMKPPMPRVSDRRYRRM
jgi:TATA-box binding protein (TBP) (component of TFIID and TFIIIB)